MYSNGCEYDILKVLLKRIDQNIPIECVKHNMFHANKMPNFTYYLSHICTIQRTCIWSILIMQNCLLEEKGLTLTVAAHLSFVTHRS